MRPHPGEGRRRSQVLTVHTGRASRGLPLSKEGAQVRGQGWGKRDRCLEAAPPGKGGSAELHCGGLPSSPALTPATTLPTSCPRCFSPVSGFHPTTSCGHTVIRIQATRERAGHSPSPSRPGWGVLRPLSVLVSMCVQACPEAAVTNDHTLSGLQPRSCVTLTPGVGRQRSSPWARMKVSGPVPPRAAGRFCSHPCPHLWPVASGPWPLVPFQSQQGQPGPSQAAISGSSSLITTFSAPVGEVLPFKGACG